MGIWSQHPQQYNEVIEESSLDKTYIRPTGKPLVQSKIAHTRSCNPAKTSSRRDIYYVPLYFVLAIPVPAFSVS